MSEKEYIERDAVLSEIDDMISNIAFSSPYQSEISTLTSGMERTRDCVENADAADVAPVVHGRWYWDVDGETGHNIRRCSVCHSGSGWAFNYCHNCGADMRDEEKRMADEDGTQI